MATIDNGTTHEDKLEEPARKKLKVDQDDNSSDKLKVNENGNSEATISPSKKREANDNDNSDKKEDLCEKSDASVNDSKDKTEEPPTKKLKVNEDSNPDKMEESLSEKVKDDDNSKISNNDGESKTENTASEKNEQKDNDTTPLQRKIIKQIEYYFGDVNLPKDKFLQEQVKLNDGWIEMSVMLKFKRLANLSSDPEVIIAALKKSTSGLMEINDDCSSIRRQPSRPLPEWNEERRAELNKRTVYVKGFPCDTNLDTLIAFFGKFGSIENVHMRMLNDKLEKKYVFKGSTFVLFKHLEEAEKFLKLESVSFKEKELIKKWQCEYISDKKAEAREIKEEQRKKFSSKRSHKEAESKKEDDDESSDDEKEETEQGRPPSPFSKTGTILYLKGFASDTTREDINEALEKFDAEVAYVDFYKGLKEAWVRLNDENTVGELVSNIDKAGKLEVCGAELEYKALEGEEEKEYLAKAKISKEERSQKHRNKGRGRSRGGGGRGRGGRGRGRGGSDKRGREDDGEGGSRRSKRLKKDS